MPYRLVKPSTEYADDFRQMCLECVTAPLPDYGLWDPEFAALSGSPDLEAFQEKIVDPLLDIHNGELARY